MDSNGIMGVANKPIAKRGEPTDGTREAYHKREEMGTDN